MRFFSKFIISFIFTIGFYCEALDCYAFRTGDANFSILKAENKILIVDCGASKPIEFQKIENRNEIFNIINDAIAIKIFITHSHQDHYNLIDTLFFYGTKFGVLTKVVPDILMIAPNDRITIFPCKIYKNTNSSREPILSWLKDSLPGCTVEALISNIVPGDDDHDHNVPIKITHSKYSLLFTGDASGHLLTRLLATQEDEVNKFLKGISFSFLPHHGSNRNCEQMWFFETKSPYNLICSEDPGHWLQKDEYEDIFVAPSIYRLLLTGKLKNIADYYHIHISSEGIELLKKERNKKEIAINPAEFYRFTERSPLELSDSISTTDIYPESAYTKDIAFFNSLCLFPEYNNDEIPELVKEEIKSVISELELIGGKELDKISNIFFDNKLNNTRKAVRALVYDKAYDALFIIYLNYIKRKMIQPQKLKESLLQIKSTLQELIF